jgi:type II secretory pathway component GspD/PulD (secretin)
VSEFIKLERADASKVVDMLKDIFEKGNQPAGGGANPNYPAGAGRAIRPVIPQQPQPQVESDVGALIGLSEESVIVGKIKIAADVRTNRIHVITRPINMPFVKKLIGEFDANVEFAKPVTRQLRYVSASDILPVLVQALQEPGENQQGAEGAGGAQGQQQNQQRRNQNNPNTNQYNTADNGSSSGSTLNISEELSTEPVDTTPKAVTVGNAKIIADQRANAIIVLGNREVVVKVEKILDEMDVKAPQVALSTVIGELTLNNNEEFGVDYFLQFKKNNLGHDVGVGGALNNTVAAPVIDPASLITFPVFSTLPAGATAYIAAGNTLSAIVKALETTGRFRTISRPMVFTSNNKKAIIASGTEIPVPVNTISSSTGGGIINTGLAQQSNIQYKKIALQLEVVPLINSDKEVSLDILQKLDNQAGTTQVDNNEIPNIATRYIRTTVSAPNGSTIVLGGLITEDKRRNTSGFPVLSRIPLVGAIFRNTTKMNQRQELIVLMRPEVTLTPLDQYHLRQRTEDKTHFGPEIDQDCPDCPTVSEGKEARLHTSDKQLPPPDLPPGG